ncbi:gastrin/cholecystokinin-like peptide [Limanda limanda]|uniref:gastrin/cholecystokinin-like peptide n=1 Tax=Limanda limanda TaxID=27771 RepID=UPI0029C6207A|nr:gastrin/cholecystokinin-like peptide [Limanda limanda]
MSGKVMLVLALLVALLVCSAASSPETTSTLQQLLAKRERNSAHRREPAPQTRSARMERRAHLSGDEREIMTKQIMKAISEVMNSECMPDRDYQGWVDFGRRDAE